MMMIRLKDHNVHEVGSVDEIESLIKSFVIEQVKSGYGKRVRHTLHTYIWNDPHDIIIAYDSLFNVYDLHFITTTLPQESNLGVAEHYWTMPEYNFDKWIPSIPADKHLATESIYWKDCLAIDNTFLIEWREDILNIIEMYEL